VTTDCLCRFESKFTIVCSCNASLFLIYVDGHSHQLQRINWGLIDLFRLFQLQRIFIGEGLGLGKNRKRQQKNKTFKNSPIKTTYRQTCGFLLLALTWVCF